MGCMKWAFLFPRLLGNETMQAQECCRKGEAYRRFPLFCWHCSIFGSSDILEYRRQPNSRSRKVHGRFVYRQRNKSYSSPIPPSPSKKKKKRMNFNVWKCRNKTGHTSCTKQASCVADQTKSKHAAHAVKYAPSVPCPSAEWYARATLCRRQLRIIILTIVFACLYFERCQKEKCCLERISPLLYRLNSILLPCNQVVIICEHIFPYQVIAIEHPFVVDKTFGVWRRLV